MKSTPLLAITFLALASPAFGMEIDKEQKTRTITLIADLDKTKSPQLSKRLIYPEPLYQSFRGSFRNLPEGYKYDYDNHTISFTKKIKDRNRAKGEVSTIYCPCEIGDLNKEPFYSHRFKYEIPDGDEDLTIQATLLSIYLDRPSKSANSASYYARETIIIYENK
jgi:hypothetical protein